MKDITSESCSPRFYGRRKGRPLNKHKAALMHGLLPCVQVEIPVQGKIDSLSLFDPKPRSVWFEVGFGGGEHLAAQAARHPDAGFLGCEPFQNGVASLLDHIDRQQLANIRIYPDDARVLLDALPDGSLARCFVLYPDPWPKKRHRERRFVNPENLDRLARTLKPNAELRLATDVAALADWMYERVAQHPAFDIVYDSPEPPHGWTVTRYEEKGIKAGRKARYIVGRREP